ncbi:MAG: diguanylate cyclase [Nannocystaceae bacterium]|nr:diguanylate cyclase [bacterium]
MGGVDACFDLFDNLSEAVVATDSEQSIVYVNAAATELFGYEAAELLGNSILLLRADPDGRSVLCAGTDRTAYRRRDGAVFLGVTVGGEIHFGPEHAPGSIQIIRVAAGMEQALDVMERLQSISIDSSLDFDARMRAILQLGAEHFDLPLAIQSRIDGDDYRVEHCVDPSGQLQPGTVFELQGTYCTHTIRAGAPTGFHHAGQSEIREHPCYLGFELESYLGCPIEVDGRVYGTVNFSRPAPSRPFTANDYALMQLIAHWAGHALSQARSRRELERLVRTDHLTGLLSRRAVFDGLNWQHAHAVRSELPLSVVLIDVDHFKRINDRWGHAVGDRVLREVADACRAVKRQVDLCGRIGGEELLFVLPDTDLEGARTFGERWLAELRSRRVSTGEDAPLTVSASLGVAQLRPEDTAEGLVARADRAMYEAKAEGRGRVKLAAVGV